MVRRLSVVVVVVYNAQTSSFLKPLARSKQNLCGVSLARGNERFFAASCHMTKMAALPIYGKNPTKIFFSATVKKWLCGMSEFDVKFDKKKTSIFLAIFGKKRQFLGLFLAKTSILG